jgi:3-keto-5-aminohexanoate cleavage enzyme
MAFDPSAPVIVQCAVTGSQPADATQRPNLPSSPTQIADAAVEAWRAGAAVVHIHAREQDGTPTQDAGVYRDILDQIHSHGCDAIINVSCGTAGGNCFADARYRVVTELAPEMASFDCGSINFGERIFEGDLPLLRRMAEAFNAAATTPEIECFDTGHVGLALQLREEGLLRDPLRIQFVLGIPGTGVPATPAMVEHLRTLLPADALWSVCAPGRMQLPMNLHCIAWGGHVRTGLEDNLYLRRGQHATNAELVKRAVRLATDAGRPLATPAHARELLRLPAPTSV